MQHIADAALPELARILFKRDAAILARHAIDMDHVGDTVEIRIKAGPHAFSVEVTNSASGHTVSGWRDDL